MYVRPSLIYFWVKASHLIDDKVFFTFLWSYKKPGNIDAIKNTLACFEITVQEMLLNFLKVECAESNPKTILNFIL